MSRFGPVFSDPPLDLAFNSQGYFFVSLPTRELLSCRHLVCSYSVHLYVTFTLDCSPVMLCCVEFCFFLRLFLSGSVITWALLLILLPLIIPIFRLIPMMCSMSPQTSTHPIPAYPITIWMLWCAFILMVGASSFSLMIISHRCHTVQLNGTAHIRVVDSSVSFLVQVSVSPHWLTCQSRMWIKATGMNKFLRWTSTPVITRCISLYILALYKIQPGEWKASRAHSCLYHAPSVSSLQQIFLLSVPSFFCPFLCHGLSVYSCYHRSCCIHFESDICVARCLGVSLALVLHRISSSNFLLSTISPCLADVTASPDLVDLLPSWHSPSIFLVQPVAPGTTYDWKTGTATVISTQLTPLASHWCNSTAVSCLSAFCLSFSSHIPFSCIAGFTFQLPIAAHLRLSLLPNRLLSCWHLVWWCVILPLPFQLGWWRLSDLHRVKPMDSKQMEKWHSGGCTPGIFTNTHLLSFYVVSLFVLFLDCFLCLFILHSLFSLFVPSLMWNL